MTFIALAKAIAGKGSMGLFFLCLVFLLLVVIFDAAVLLSLWLIGVDIDWWSLKPWLGATLLALLVAD